MLERMREGSQGVLAKSILVLIILSFALVGVGDYLGRASENAIVVVNGETITANSVDQAYQNERARLQQQYGEQFDLIASNPNFVSQIRAQATQTLVNERLMAQTIEAMGLRVSDEQVKQEIRKTAEFQREGKFDNDLYLSVLRSSSLSPSQFSVNLKRDLVRLQLLQTLVGSEFILPLEVELADKLETQKRVVRVLNVKNDDFKVAETVSDSEIDTFYAANSESFQNAEQVSVEYILLDIAALTSKVVVTEEDIQAYYEDHEDEYRRVERRKVAHILIQGDSAEAKAKAETLSAEIKAGADFAKLAATKSEDIYSAKNNGELDWFERGVMDPAFDKSAFLLTSTAPISDVVKSEFGFHIIKLIEAQESQVLPLSDVKSKVEAALKDNKVKEMYHDLYDELGTLAFESDDLEEASEKVGISITNSELFSANNVPSELNNRVILAQIFNDEFRDAQLNSDIISLSDTQAIVVRVNEYKAAAIKPLVDVSEQIRLQLTQQKSTAAAKAFVESIIAKLESGESVDSDLTAKNMTFDEPLTLTRYSRDLDVQVVQRLFQLAKPDTDKVTRDYVVTAKGDFALIEFSKIIAFDKSATNEAAKTQLASKLERSTSEETYQALVAHLLDNAEIVYTTP